MEAGIFALSWKDLITCVSEFSHFPVGIGNFSHYYLFLFPKEIKIQKYKSFHIITIFQVLLFIFSLPDEIAKTSVVIISDHSHLEKPQVDAAHRLFMS